MSFHRIRLILCAVFLLTLATGLVAETPASSPVRQDASADDSSEDSDAESAEDESVLFERVRVTGSPDKIRTIPGSVTYIGEEQLAEQDYSDVHRILARVPGVHVQEEDGYGLRPNIGMRGSGSERSSKITTMEDGVLIAPAPYAAPSAYYFPTAGRMEGIEVRKGSSSIQHGPFTNGGVVNFISSSIPSSFGGDLNLSVGDNETLRGKFKIGDSKERFGWLFETYQHDTAGFKTLDNGGETGFDLEDYLAKFRFNSGTDSKIFQALEIKAGKTKQFGHETYVGLTDADFEANPFRRYAGSQEDNIDTDHDQIQARYLVKPNRLIDLTATAYRNDFFRNWRKLQSVGGQSLGDVLTETTTFAAELAILRGDLAVDSADDVLMLRNNRRDYYSQGLHVVMGIKPESNGTQHDIEVGVRYHEDEEDRFQEEDGFRMTADGLMEQSSSGAPGSQSNRVNRGESLALFVKDTIRVGDWTITPGARLESIDFSRVDYGDAERTVVSAQRANSLNEIIPGIGVSYVLDGTSSLFGGVHRGFAPPGPSAVDAEAEDSVNFELGYRRDADGLATEVVGFYNDYSNLLGACTVSSGCSSGDVGDVFDGGEVRVFGVEASLRYDLAQGRGSKFSVPLNLNYTFTNGEFENAFDSDYDPWGNVGVGDELPYLPEHTATLGIGVSHRKWGLFSNLIYVDEMRTVAGQGAIPLAESTDGHFLVDLSTHYSWTRKLRVFAQVRNLTDEIYVAARRPSGVRPGIDRTLMLGLGYEF